MNHRMKPTLGFVDNHLKESSGPSLSGNTSTASEVTGFPLKQGRNTSTKIDSLDALAAAFPEAWLASMEVVRSRVRPIHWQIFEAYLMENQSSRQVARQFQTSSNNVRIITYRIKKQLQAHRDHLVKQQNGDGDVSQLKSSEILDVADSSGGVSQ